MATPARCLTVAAAALAVAVGCVAFFAPDWSASAFPWTVKPLFAMTAGAYLIGTGVTALLAARVWTWSVAGGCLVYLWVFSVGQTVVVIGDWHQLRIGEPLGIPLLITLIVLDAATALGVSAQLMSRAPAAERPRTNGWATRVIAVAFGVAVIALAVLDLNGTRPDRVYPGKLPQLSGHAYAAAFLALALAAFATAVARDVKSLLLFIAGGLAITIPIVITNFVQLEHFHFSAHPGQVLYFGAYVGTVLVAPLILLWQRGETRQLFTLLRGTRSRAG